MANSFYIRSQKKYLEYQMFMDKLNNKWIPKIKEYANKLVQEGQVSFDVDFLIDNVFNTYNVYPDDICDEYRLGILSYSGFQFDGYLYGEDKTWISDLKTLEDFLKNHPDYSIINDENQAITYTEFTNILREASKEYGNNL